MAAQSFDELRDDIVSRLQACTATCGHLLDQCGLGPDFEIVVAGMSETAGPSAYLVASHDRFGEPWAVIDLSGLTVLPNDPELHERALNIAAGRGADAIDPIKDGLAIMEAQRAHPQLSNGDTCYVGGFAQLTTIDATGVHSRVIHRWPDTVGEKVAA